MLARNVAYVSAIGVYRRLYAAGVEIVTAALPRSHDLRAHELGTTVRVGGDWLTILAAGSRLLAPGCWLSSLEAGSWKLEAES